MAGSLDTAVSRSAKRARPLARSVSTCCSMSAVLSTLACPVAKKLCQKSAIRSGMAWGAYCMRKAR